jgi:hypothetical protein
MHNRDHKYLIVAGVVKDRERKAGNQSPSDIGSFNGSGLRKLKDAIRGLLDSIKKIHTKTLDSGLIETRDSNFSSEASGWKITFIA